MGLLFVMMMARDFDVHRGTKSHSLDIIYIYLIEFPQALFIYIFSNSQISNKQIAHHQISVTYFNNYFMQFAIFTSSWPGIKNWYG